VSGTRERGVKVYVQDAPDLEDVLAMVYGIPMTERIVHHLCGGVKLQTRKMGIDERTTVAFSVSLW
jgi:hypothetical protein